MAKPKPTSASQLTPNATAASSTSSVALVAWTSQATERWEELSTQLQHRDLLQSSAIQERILICIESSDSEGAKGETRSLGQWKVVRAANQSEAQQQALKLTRSEKLLLVDLDRIASCSDLDLVARYAQRHDWVHVRSVNSTGRWYRRLLRWGIDRFAWLVTRSGSRHALSPVKSVPRDAWRKAISNSSRDYRPDHWLSSLETAVLLRRLSLSVLDVPARLEERVTPASLGNSWWRTILSLLLIVRLAWKQTWFPAHDREAETTPVNHQRLGWFLCSLVLIGAIPFFFGNLGFALAEPDEVRNVQIALEMEASGDFVLPTRHRAPYLDKPAMLFWAMSTSMEWFGRTPWAARLPLAFAGWMTVAAIVLVGSRRFGAVAASIGGVLLMTCIGFALVTRFVITDSILTCCMTWAALSLHRGMGPKSWKSVWWLIAGIALGVGALTKGPVAPVLVLPPFVFWLWLEKQLNWRAFVSSLWILIPLVVIPLPWFMAVALREPEQLEYFFWKHNVVRFTNAFNHQQPFWFYVPVVLAGMFPTSMLLPSLIVSLLSRRSSLQRLRSKNDGFLWMSALTTIGFFSISSAKLPTYILPALPLLALITGRFVVRVLLSHRAQQGLLEQGYHRHLARWLPLQAGCVMIIIGIGAAIAERQIVDTIQTLDWIEWPVIASAILLVGLSLRWFSGAFMSRWATLGLATPIVLGYVFADVYPDGVARRSYFPDAMNELAKWQETQPISVATGAPRTLRMVSHSTDSTRAVDPSSEIPVVWFGRLSDTAGLHASIDPDHQFGEDQVHGLCAMVLREHAKGHHEVMVVTIPGHAKLIEARMPLGFELEPIREDGLLWIIRPKPLVPDLSQDLMAERNSETATR